MSQTHPSVSLLLLRKSKGTMWKGEGMLGVRSLVFSKTVSLISSHRVQKNQSTGPDDETSGMRSMAAEI